jgi:hypothetical protein
MNFPAVNIDYFLGTSYGADVSHTYRILKKFYRHFPTLQTDLKY